ncbi:protein kinase [Micromonospora sp. NPDC049051]|uniref:protein kinase domain-containing protein n=1 Tax=unclassified Micromonospora TaxID=2617518 RepID=UPI003715F680
MQESRLVAGRYRLDEVVGRGGMGVVWRATDELIGRQVAVKEIRADPGLPAQDRALFGQRALREARTAGRISHPAVIAVHDVVPPTGDDEALYIVSELVAAPSLAEVLKRGGALPPARVGTLAVRVLDALAAAHAAGVVHRDVKPGNILVLDGDRVKLVDFGIARADGDSRLTHTGVMGSTGYLAPELFHGAEPGPAADLWALGVTLLEAVDGVAPFDRASTAATIHAVLHDDPPPVRCAPPLSVVIAGLLVRDPEHRMTLDRARTLLTGETTDAGVAVTHGPAGEAGPVAPADSGGSASGAAGDWESAPTTTHATIRADGTGRSDPDEGYQVVPPPAIRRTNLVAYVLVPALAGWLGWLLLHKTLGVPSYLTVAAAVVLWLVGTIGIQAPWSARLEITDDALVLRGPSTPKQAGRDAALAWDDLDVLALVATRHPHRTRLFLGVAAPQAAAPVMVPPLRAFLNSRPGSGPVLVVGDIRAGSEELAEAMEGVVPGRCPVVTSRRAAPDRQVVPRRAILVSWIVVVVLLLGATLYYRHESADIRVLTKESVSVLAYGPEHRLFSGGRDGTITIWDTTTGQATAVLDGHTDPVTALDVSHDGRLLASGTQEGTIKVWDVAAQRVAATLGGDDDPWVESLRFSPDRSMLVAATTGGVRLWSVTGRVRSIPIDADDIDVSLVRFSADGGLLLGVDEKKNTRWFWRTSTGARVGPAGSFGPMANVRPDNSVVIRDAGSDEIVTTLRGGAAEVRATAFGPGDLFATSTWDDLRVWRTTTGRTVHSKGLGLTDIGVPDCDSLAFDAQGTALACGGTDGIRVWTLGAERPR